LDTPPNSATNDRTVSATVPARPPGLATTARQPGLSPKQGRVLHPGQRPAWPSAPRRPCSSSTSSAGGHVAPVRPRAAHHGVQV